MLASAGILAAGVAGMQADRRVAYLIPFGQHPGRPQPRARGEKDQHPPPRRDASMKRRLMSAAPLLCALLGGARAEILAAQEPVPPHETFTLESRAVGETRRIAVYTPPGYDPAGAARYPVLYMPDGGVREDFPHVAATVDAGIRAGELRPMLVVGIENTQRRRDMTGPTEVEEDRKIAPRVGGSAAFRAFIADELMPEVRRRYRTNDETAIIGESLAGLFVVETFLLQPELFDIYVALDPSLWWNGGELVRTAPERIRSRPSSVHRPPTTVFLASADVEDIAVPTARLAEVLRENAWHQLRSRYTPRPDLTHATIYRAVGPGALRDVLRPELADTAGVVRAVAAHLAHAVAERASQDHPVFLGASETAFDSAVAAALLALAPCMAPPSPAPESMTWVRTRGFTMRGDTAAVLMESGSQSPRTHGITTFIQEYRHLYVPEGDGWRLTGYEHVRSVDIGPVRE
jgi:predicted alpha/beta superfamily hydrolase